MSGRGRMKKRQGRAAAIPRPARQSPGRPCDPEDWPEPLRREMATTGIRVVPVSGRVRWEWMDGERICEWSGVGDPAAAFEECCRVAERRLGIVAAAAIKHHPPERRTMHGWREIEFTEIVHTTDTALLVLIGDEEVWIPRSQVEDGESVEEGDGPGTLVVSEWIAREKGL